MCYVPLVHTVRGIKHVLWTLRMLGTTILNFHDRGELISRFDRQHCTYVVTDTFVVQPHVCSRSRSPGVRRGGGVVPGCILCTFPRFVLQTFSSSEANCAVGVEMICFEGFE